MLKITKNTRFEAGLITKTGRAICGAGGTKAVLSPPPSAPFPMNIAIAVTFGVASLAAHGVSKLNLKRHQKYRDQRAEQILHEIRSSKNSPAFSLYLRSFITTGKLLEMLEKKTILPFNYDDTDLEIFIASAVEPFAPLVALGKKGEQVGAGRIESSESDWQRLLKLLAEKAKLIFIIPYDSGGTKWEIDFIKKNKLIKKTIFVMPPQGIKSLNWSEQWRKVASSVKISGFQLPSYNTNGMLFSMVSSKKIKHSEDFIVEKSFRKMNKKIQLYCKQVISI